MKMRFPRLNYQESKQSFPVCPMHNLVTQCNASDRLCPARHRLCHHNHSPDQTDGSCGNPSHRNTDHSNLCVDVHCCYEQVHSHVLLGWCWVCVPLGWCWD